MGVVGTVGFGVCPKVPSLSPDSYLRVSDRKDCLYRPDERSTGAKKKGARAPKNRGGQAGNHNISELRRVSFHFELTA